MVEYDTNILVFREDESIRTFLSSDFNFVFDKGSGMSICWGKIKEQTPTFDPIGPETVFLKLDENFKFMDNFNTILKLFNITKKDGEEHYKSVSTISNVNLILNSLYMKNGIEVKNLIDFLTKYSYSINLILNYQDDFTLRDVLKINLLNIKNVTFVINSFKNKNIIETINLFLSKNIFVNCNFNINKENFKEFTELLLDNYPKNTFSTIKLDLDILKSQKKKLSKLLLDNNINMSVIGNDVDKFGFLCVEHEDYSLFSCIFDFTNFTVYPSFDTNKKCVLMKNINSISDYWKSKKFTKIRNSLIKDKKYEEDIVNNSEDVVNNSEDMKKKEEK